jgi:hypothetical protein
MRLEVYTAVNIHIVIWVTTPCSQAGGQDGGGLLEDGGDTFFRNVVTTCKTTWRHNPEDCNPQTKNKKTNNLGFFFS